MNKMNKIVGMTIDLIICFFQISRLIALGVEYPHIVAGLSGALLVTTQLKDRTLIDKFWYATGGFSFACYVAPYICEVNGCDLTSTLCLGIYFFSGVAGMGFVELILSIMKETKGYIPKLVMELFRLFILKIKNFLGVNETVSSKPTNGSDGVDGSGSATISNDNS